MLGLKQDLTVATLGPNLLSNLYSGYVYDFDGLGSPSGLAPSLHLNSPSVEMVPDSLDGLENHLEGQIRIVAEEKRCGGKSSLAPASANSSSLSFRKKSGNSFYNASHRREVRRVVRHLLSLGFDSFLMMNFSIITWNIRGLGRGEKVRAVRRVLTKQKPNFLFLPETKLLCFKSSVLHKLWYKPGFVHCFSPSKGSAGGLLCMWDGDWFIAEDLFVKERFIAITGKLKSNGWQCGFLNVYGPSVDSKKREFFGELLSFLNLYNIPWFVGGDFNSYLNVEEKSGCLVNMTLWRFSDTLSMRLIWLICICKGGSFTWSSNRKPPTLVHLDRFLLPAGRGRFVDMVVSNLHTIKNKRRGVGILGLLKESKFAIKQWCGNQNYDVNKSILSLEDKIRDIECKIQLGFYNSSLLDGWIFRMMELLKELRKEERIWLQKSRVKWFVGGDRNTKFFHLFASHRRRANSLACIRINGAMAYNDKTAIEVENMILSFSKLSEDFKATLEAPFTEKEVWLVICSSDSNKAPGPNDFNMLFFKRFWPNLKGEIMKFFGDFFHGKH
ncbi:hypothetical protein GQ457_09G021080 [Hibiscus cannabinus]